jgi:hypothetical protein
MDKRKEPREQIIGDVCWSYASDSNENTGVLIEESKSGMSIMTYAPVKEGSILRIEFNGSWQGTRYVTVKWCREIALNNYRCGLSVIKHY